jgi:hypothetical protein
MAKGYEANKARQEWIASFGKELGRRAGFVCEWCGGKGDLRPQETDPVAEPDLENLLFLCGECRDLYGGADRDPDQLRHMEGVLWSPEPVVARCAAQVLRRLGATWAEETIEMAGLDEEVD